MIINYIKIAFRTLRKNSLFSCINIFGLALSMSVCLIGIMIIKDAFSYDHFHPNSDRTYRIITDVRTKEGKNERWATTPLPLSKKLSHDYPFVEKTATVYTAVSDAVTYGSKTISLEGAFTESSFFEVFGFELLLGNKHSALSKPYSIVLTEEAAEKFFKNENPIGKVVDFKTFGNSFIVTGVIKSNQVKSHIDHDVYVSLNTVPSLEALKKISASLNSWKDYYAASVYVLLQPNTDKEKLKNALVDIGQTAYSNSLPENIKQLKFELQPLDEITPGEELINGGNIVSVITLISIGGITFLILLLACFNYTNLSLARSLTRAREVGIRKVVGGSRMQLFLQFIIESILVSFIALVFAYLILNILMNAEVVSQGILNNVKPDFSLWLIFLCFTVFTGLIAGSIPAWILSSFKPIQVLKNLSSVKIFKGLGLQKTLIVIQFAVSLVFVIFLTTIYQQTKHLTTFSYGFNEKNIIHIPISKDNREILKEKISSIVGVEQVAAISSLMGFHPTALSIVKTNKDSEGISTDCYYIDENFIPLMELKLVAGDNFDKNSNKSEQLVVINEHAAKNLQFKNSEDAIGKTIYVNDSLHVMVAGVVNDFNYLNPRHPIGNLIFQYEPAKFEYLALKINPVGGKNSLTGIEKIWSDINPNHTFTVSWFEDELKKVRTQTEEFPIVAFLALMAITIACIGLLGIATYTSRMRQKEVTIRKIMGAGIKSIFLMLSKDFAKLLLFAGLLGLPVGYFLSDSFLQEFAYRIAVGWEILLTSIVLISVLGIITISSQTLRVALTNPVKNLRTE